MRWSLFLSIALHTGLILGFHPKGLVDIERDVIAIQLLERRPTSLISHLLSGPRSVREHRRSRHASSASSSTQTSSHGSPDTSDILSQYLSTVVARVRVAENYPRAARKRGHEGRVIIGVKIASDGAILQSAIITQCPFETLNREALESVRRIQRFVPFPNGLQQSFLEVKIPIEYRLQ